MLEILFFNNSIFIEIDSARPTEVSLCHRRNNTLSSHTIRFTIEDMFMLFLMLHHRLIKYCFALFVIKVNTHEYEIHGVAKSMG